MSKRYLRPVWLLLAGFALAGCWESSDVTFHQPGEYHGPLDDLNTDRAVLQERMSIQRDR